MGFSTLPHRIVTSKSGGPTIVLCWTLQGHGHWVSTMAFSTDYTLCTRAFEPAKASVNASKCPYRSKRSRLCGARALRGWCLAQKTSPYPLALCREQEAPWMNDWTPWSADSQLLVIGSSKGLGHGAQKLDTDLPGHTDEVYAINWNPESQRVASGEDKYLGIWRR